ncbi:MAG TPA: ATP-binding protein [Candidatus Gallacutalibacter stercoravium]|nr:ATP-binding protein [Candidatus Gallacutalibacter stercoravium]
MERAQEAAFALASLSVYKGILNRTVPRAFYRLLRAYDAPPLEFAAAWGEFFSLLCNRGYSDDLAACISETVLFDENAFSRAAAAGREEQLPGQVMEAVKRDIGLLLEVSRLTPEQILQSYLHREELCGMGATLPGWAVGRPVAQLAGKIEDCVAQMAAYYRRNGCGMYARYRAFIWQDGGIEPVRYPDPIQLSSLKGYEVPRGRVLDNTLAFLEGLPANNCLLYGDRGTGKSSTVKAILNEYYSRGLRMVEMPKERLQDFPKLVDQIAPLPLCFIIYIDDLSFSQQDDTFAALKAVLEGGLAARPANALIYATSNRRHLLRERFSDREGDEVHRGDTIQESLSLSDRFGLAVNFSVPGKESYLEIVRALALERGLEAQLPQLEAGAERWALERGGRSPRCARQYVALAESRLRRGLPL